MLGAIPGVGLLFKGIGSGVLWIANQDVMILSPVIKSIFGTF